MSFRWQISKKLFCRQFNLGSYDEKISLFLADCLAAGLAWLRRQPAGCYPKSIGPISLCRLNIDGPAEVVGGQLVRLIADIEPAESPFWIVLKPVNLDYEQVDNGQRLIFAVACEPPDDLIVMLLAQRVVNDRIVTRQLFAESQSNRSTDLPSPVDPGEPLPVDPPLTDLPIYQAVLAAWNSIPSQSAKAKSNRVADNFANTAKLCAIGELTAIPDIWGIAGGQTMLRR